MTSAVFAAGAYTYHSALFSPPMPAAVHDQALTGDSVASAKVRKEAARGVHRLLESLEGVMAVPAYLDALLALALHTVDKPRRRALKLFAEKVAAAGAGDADGDEAGAEGRQGRDPEAAAAATRLCGALPALLGTAGAQCHCLVPPSAESPCATHVPAHVSMGGER